MMIDCLKLLMMSMKNDDRLLEIANDVGKMVDMLRDMKVWLDRSYRHAQRHESLAR